MSYKCKFTGEQVDEYLTRVEEAGNLLEIKEGLAEKANTDGYYPSMRVGLSDNLPDRRDVIEGEIGFRESAGVGNSIEDGTAEVVELLGNSVVWNQVYPTDWVRERSGVKSTSVDGIVSVVGTLTESYFNFQEFTDNVANHVYLFEFNTKSSVFNGYSFELLNGVNQKSTINNGHAAILHNNTNSSMGKSIGIIMSKGITLNEKVTISQYDLTLMFGAGNEPSSIDDFYARIPQGIDLNAYNEGEVIGVNMKGIKSVNDNAWDEEWEQGYINTEGEDGYSGEDIRSKNYIRVLGGATYMMPYNITAYHPDASHYFYVLFYDREYRVLGSKTLYPNWSQDTWKVEMPSSCQYIRFYTNLEGATYKNDICIRLAHSGYKTDYVPHEEDVMPFKMPKELPYGMHGINGVSDSVKKDEVVRRIGVVDLGTLEYGRGSTNLADSSRMRAITPLVNAVAPTSDGDVANILCDRYIAVSNNENWHNKEGVCIGADGYLYAYDADIQDTASFKSAMQGVMLYYELAEPVVTKLDSQLNLSYKVWDFGTEELLCDKPSTDVGVRTIYGFNATDTIRGNKAKNNEHEDRIEDIESTMVRKEGYAPKLTSGFADNLVGRGESIPAEFSFRASGGKSIEDGTARIKTLKGNAVVWNQVYPTDWVQGISTSVNGVISIIGTLAENYIRFNEFNSNIQGHNYLFILETDAVFDGKNFSLLNRNKNVAIANGMAYIFHSNTDATLQRYIGIKSLVVGETLNATARVRQIDLTQMFGAGNEPTTIEEFNARKPIVEDENAYNEGEVIPFTAEGIKSVGDNAWDEEWEVGAFNADGIPLTTSAGIRSKNMFHVIGGDQYYIYGETKAGSLYAWFYFYDRDMNFIKRNAAYLPSSTDNADYDNPVTAPTNAAFAKFYVSQAYGSTYNHDITISLYHSGWKAEVDATYKPYEQDIRKIDSRILEAFPNGMMPWDKVYNKNGKGYIVKGTGVVDMGDLKWSYSSLAAHYANLPMIKLPTRDAERLQGLLCSQYSLSDNAAVLEMSDKTMLRFPDGNIYIKDSSYTDAASFKTAMQGVLLYYELAEPTIIEYDEPFNLDYLVWDFGTEQIIADKPSAPLKADIIYQFNAVDEIRELRQLIATMQAQLASLTSNNGGQ